MLLFQPAALHVLLKLELVVGVLNPRLFDLELHGQNLLLVCDPVLLNVKFLLLGTLLRNRDCVELILKLSLRALLSAAFLLSLDSAFVALLMVIRFNFYRRYVIA